MIVSALKPKEGFCSVRVESADDLWVLRRLIEKGDVVVTRASRVIKRQEEYARPDKGERIKITIALYVEDIKLDSSVERLRVRGTIREASDESVSRAGSHSVSISPGHALTVQKETWTSLHTSLINSSQRYATRFILVAIDRREAGIGTLSGSHLTVLTTVDSGASGKHFEVAEAKGYIGKVSDIAKSTWKEGDTIVVAGPGHTKLALANVLSSDQDLSSHTKIVEGFDLTGSDGVRALIKSEEFQKIASDSALVQVLATVTEAVRRISMGDARVAYTLQRVGDAARNGAVECCVVSDDAFVGGTREEEVVSVMNEVEEKGGKVHLVDSSLELGKQVSSFGGMVALLRYSLTPY